MIKRLICFLLVASLLLLRVSAQEVVVMTVPDTQGAHVNASAAIVMEAATGRVLFAQNAEERLPFASTTKIMTALIALEQPDIDTVFEVNPDAIKVEGSSMGLQEGDMVSLQALAVGMLLSSGNDAANAAAVRIAGSTEEFVELMNRRAAELGLENTSFETPSGLDGDNHYSTAYDLACLARVALNTDAFKAICSQYKMRISYGNPPYDRWLTNHNKLLNYYEGTVGLKTGFTKKAGRCLVSAAERDGVTLIVVTLNCPDDWNTHENLYERYFPQLQVEDLAKSMPEVELPVTGGAAPSVKAVPYQSAQIPVPVDGADITYNIKTEQFLYAPILSGQTLGQVEILLDGQQVAALTLMAEADVPLKYPYEEEPEGLWGWITGLLP